MQCKKHGGRPRQVSVAQLSGNDLPLVFPGMEVLVRRNFSNLPRLTNYHCHPVPWVAVVVREAGMVWGSGSRSMGEEGWWVGGRLHAVGCRGKGGRRHTIAKGGVK